MWADRVSNPGPLTPESGALLTALNGSSPDGFLLRLNRTRSWIPMIPYIRLLWSNFCVYVSC